VVIELAGAARGFASGLLAAMERRLRQQELEAQRELERQRLEAEREWREWQRQYQQAQLDLQRSQYGPLDLTSLFQMAGIQTPGPVLLPREVASPVVSAVAERLFRDPQEQQVDLGRFDQTLAGIQVPASQVLQHLNRLRPEQKWETQPISAELAQALGMPSLAGQPLGSLSSIGGFMRDIAGAEESRERASWIGPQAEANIRRALAAAGLDEARRREIETTLPYTVEKLRADTELTQALRDLRVEEGRTEAATRDAAVRLIEAQISRMDAETQRTWQLLPYEVKHTIAETLRAEADAYRLQAETDLTQLQVQVLRGTMPAQVRRAEAEARRAEAEAGKAEAELDLTKRYAAQEREANIQRILADTERTKAETGRTKVETQIGRLEQHYLEATLPERVSQALLQRNLLQIQIDQAYAQLQQAELQLAIARRLGGFQEEQARLQVQRLQQQIAQLELQNRLLERDLQEVQSIDPRDPDALLKLYEADTRQFREAGMWVPPYQDYVEFVRSGGGDWAAEVAAYNEAATALLGPARREEADMTAKDHLSLARAIYEAKYWLGGKNTPTFEQFLRTEYWPSYEQMRRLLDPTTANEYVFDPVLEATLYLQTMGGDVDAAIKELERNQEQLVRSGALTREQVQQILEVLRREKEARGSTGENVGILRRIWEWIWGRR